MNRPDARLERLLGGRGLAALRQRLRRHFERQIEPDTGRILHLGGLEPAEREALALLTGRPVSTARSARIDLAAIDAAMQAAGLCESLREALERLDGPIENRTALRTAAKQAWAAMLQRTGRDPRLLAWLQTSAARALLKRLARRDAVLAEALLAQADAVMRRLPASGLPRAQLAAQVLGNAHALDAGQPVASLVLAALRRGGAHHHGAVPGTDVPAAHGGDEPADEERARSVWARAGVLVNELARPVLLLNLPVGGGPLFEQGEPAYLSLRRLLRDPPRWAVQSRDIYVCENPNLLAIAADRLGACCAPFVCTDGMPAAAQRTLLDQLAGAGARLYYHGDFDWPGLRIANHVLRRWPARPWRMHARDYEAAVQAAPHRKRDLASSRIVASWDPQLASAMHRHGLAVAEEAVADSLIEDLRLG